MRGDKTLTNTNKKFINFDFQHILSDFYQLQHVMEQPHTEYVRRYAIVRTVTLVEQFFREVIVFKLLDGKCIKSQNISLTKHLILSAFAQYEQIDPYIAPDVVWQQVKNFTQKNSKDGAYYSSKEERARIPIKMLKQLIESCSEHPVHWLSYRLIGQSHSFQNTWEINRTMLELKIFTEKNKIKSKIKEKLDELFDSRHILIHSIGKVNLDVRPYFQID